MKISRREFIRLSMLSGCAAGAFGAGLLSWPRRVNAFYQSPMIQKFGPGQVLRGVGPGGIPVAAPDLTVAPVTGVRHYTINIKQFTDQLHPSLGPATLWGYHPGLALGGGAQSQRHLGGIIVANKGVPIQVTFQNWLPPKHILPVDTTIMGANQPPNRVATHLHGGMVPWISDGSPYTWFGPNGTYGPSFLNNQVLNPTALPGQAEYYYPNSQSARLMWHHDHAVGITRLNAYAGIASAYVLRDAFEGGLRNMGLPDYVERGGHEIPLIIQDKIFVDEATIMAMDPTWTGPTTTGSLWYPHVYEGRWTITPGGMPLPALSVVPEMFGDTMLANGTVFPVAPVEPRRYRLRILNACQARFLNLQLYVDDGSPDGITLDPVALTPINLKGPDFLVIGTEGGFLRKPVLRPSNITFDPATLEGSLVTCPAERWDVIVDFSGFAGKKIIMYNDAPAPFPTGDPLNDYFPGAPLNPTNTVPGFGPNTRQVLRFDVGFTVTPPADKAMGITAATDLTPGLDPFLAPYDPSGIPVPPPGVPVRNLTLNEISDAYGRLIQMLGTNIMVSPGLFARGYLDPATELPAAGSVEIWQIVNLTGDTHSIHFHVVNAQVLWRRPFNALSYSGTPTFTGPPTYPSPLEQGWKETVKMHPGEVIAVIMQFNLPRVPFIVPPSPRTGGHEYVWHCHILEHEEHDMMRPLVIV